MWRARSRAVLVALAVLGALLGAAAQEADSTLAQDVQEALERRAAENGTTAWVAGAAAPALGACDSRVEVRCAETCPDCLADCACYGHGECNDCVLDCKCYGECGRCYGDCTCFGECAKCERECECNGDCDACTEDCSCNGECARCVTGCRCESECAKCEQDCICAGACPKCVGATCDCYLGTDAGMDAGALEMAQWFEEEAATQLVRDKFANASPAYLAHVIANTHHGKAGAALAPPPPEEAQAQSVNDWITIADNG